MVSEELILKLARAIAKEEGFYVLNSVPQRAHNPGDLTDEGDVGFGTVETKGPHGAKITIYPDDAKGWDALYKKVRRMLSGASHTYTLDLTVMEVALKWAGDPVWARNVAAAIGVDTTATLAQIVEQDIKKQNEPEIEAYAMGGRRPLPTEVKKVRGNPGKRPLNENEPQAQAGEPKMPADLPELAQQEWKSIVPLLLKLSVLTEVDGKALAAYCYCFARWIQAEKEVAERGILIEEPIVSRETGEIMGYKVKKNPAIPIVTEALRGMKSYLIEFGLTPASRSRLHVEKEKPVDPADLYFSKKALTGRHVN